MKTRSSGLVFAWAQRTADFCKCCG